MPTPVWRGGSNEQLLQILETVVKSIKAHNVDQEALRQDIRDAQELDQ